MARLQILELPEGSEDDRPPFVLVVDQADDATADDITRWPSNMAECIGARYVLVFEDTIDIPANDTSTYSPTTAQELHLTLDEREVRAAVTADAQKMREANEDRILDSRQAHLDAQRLADERTDIARDMNRLAKWRDELADALGMGQGNRWDDIRNAAAQFRSELIRSENARERLRQDRDEARTWARHGYEIGQKHCGWTDHGVAPDWLTEGWPNSFDSCEHLKRAAEYDTALSRVRALPDQPQDRGAEYEHPNAYLFGYLNATREAKRAAQIDQPATDA